MPVDAVTLAIHIPVLVIACSTILYALRSKFFAGEHCVPGICASFLLSTSLLVATSCYAIATPPGYFSENNDSLPHNVDQFLGCVFAILIWVHMFDILSPLRPIRTRNSDDADAEKGSHDVYLKYYSMRYIRFYTYPFAVVCVLGGIITWLKGLFYGAIIVLCCAIFVHFLVFLVWVFRRYKYIRPLGWSFNFFVALVLCNIINSILSFILAPVTVQLILSAILIKYAGAVALALVVWAYPRSWFPSMKASTQATVQHQGTSVGRAQVATRNVLIATRNTENSQQQGQREQQNEEQMVRIQVGARIYMVDRRHEQNRQQQQQEYQTINEDRERGRISINHNLESRRAEVLARNRMITAEHNRRERQLQLLRERQLQLLRERQAGEQVNRVQVGSRIYEIQIPANNRDSSITSSNENRERQQRGSRQRQSLSSSFTPMLSDYSSNNDFANGDDLPTYYHVDIDLPPPPPYSRL
ncbi:hypothetical protein BDB00DRAFT_797630 [Zychaea mexicana]|uniref:uncharacterized protein n=1 Tax=Zychaea mexicana TaxID=64656 RepID=UPI0022FF0BEA|nr:uncharacterized protein BDB00DRAFT_797630 [Zychaea mexicana]KAI9498980.1 hypothetical protein BDB00DRAFT_797630 [Zychaea mexicana]